jgi:hypothetical protein
MTALQQTNWLLQASKSALRLPWLTAISHVGLLLTSSVRIFDVLHSFFHSSLIEAHPIHRIESNS